MRLYDHGRRAIAAGLPVDRSPASPICSRTSTARSAGVPDDPREPFSLPTWCRQPGGELVKTPEARPGSYIFGKDQHLRDGPQRSRASRSSTGRPAIPGTPERTAGRLEREARRRRWPRAWSRWRMRPTASARSASRRRAAASSASSPTRARNSLAPYLGEAVAGLVSEHAVTLTVRDCAALLDATVRTRRGGSLLRPAAGAALSAGGRRRSWPAPHRLHRRRSERRRGGAGVRGHPRADGQAVRRSGARRGGPRRSSTAPLAWRTFLTLVAVGMKLNLGKSPDRRSAAARRRGRAGDDGDGAARRVDRCRRLRARHPDRPSPGAPDCAIPSPVRRPPHARPRARPRSSSAGWT